MNSDKLRSWAQAPHFRILNFWAAPTHEDELIRRAWALRKSALTSTSSWVGAHDIRDHAYKLSQVIAGRDLRELVAALDPLTASLTARRASVARASLLDLVERLRCDIVAELTAPTPTRRLGEANVVLLDSRYPEAVYRLELSYPDHPVTGGHDPTRIDMRICDRSGHLQYAQSQRLEDLGLAPGFPVDARLAALCVAHWLSGYHVAPIHVASEPTP